MTLTEDCWGHVNVCVEGNCGGVRSDTWPEEKSQALCRNLECGRSIATTERPAGKSEVIVESLHTFLQNPNLNQSVLVLSKIRPKGYQPNHRSAYVVCSGNDAPAPNHQLRLGFHKGTSDISLGGRIGFKIE